MVLGAVVASIYGEEGLWTFSRKGLDGPAGPRTAEATVTAAAGRPTGRTTSGTGTRRCEMGFENAWEKDGMGGCISHGGLEQSSGGNGSTDH